MFCLLSIQMIYSMKIVSEKKYMCLPYLGFNQGVRRLGAAAVDMCHVALGIVEAYWEYRLKPWDMAAGVLVMLLFTLYLEDKS